MIEIISGLILGGAFGFLLASNHILRKRHEILKYEIEFLENRIDASDKILIELQNKVYDLELPKEVTSFTSGTPISVTPGESIDIQQSVKAIAEQFGFPYEDKELTRKIERHNSYMAQNCAPGRQNKEK